jgi:hypothetical protein
MCIAAVIAHAYESGELVRAHEPMWARPWGKRLGAAHPSDDRSAAEATALRRARRSSMDAMLGADLAGAENARRARLTQRTRNAQASN